MSFLRKITLSIFIFVMFLGVSPFFVKADSDQELVSFLETLITIGVIPSAKADLARTILNSALSDSSTRINRDLSKGSTGNDVKLLQKILNTNPSTIVASSGLGSSGNETTYFGSATEAAVIKFQNFYSFSPTGIVAGVTRAKVNALLSIVTNADVPEAERPSVDLKVNGQDDNVQVGSGGTATILWTSANVTSCVSGTNKIKPTYGTESVTVVSYTQFEMTCVGPKGIVSDSVTVSVTNNAQTVVPQNLVVLGNNSELSSTTIIIVIPPATTTPNNPATTTKNLTIKVNGQTNYATTTSSTSLAFGLGWTSTGFTVCKFTSNPIITNPIDVPIPSTAITAGSAIITTSPNAVGMITFTMACATGTSAINTLNQNPVSSLSPSTNLMIATSTLSISNPLIPNNPATTTKSLNIYVNGQTNYATTTSSATTTSVVSWSSTGLLICKATSNPTISGFSEAMGYANGTTTITTHFTSAGTAAYTLVIACATGTATTSLLENPVGTLIPSENLLISTSTLSIIYSPVASSTSITGPDDVAKIIGYGPVNYWMGIDSASLAVQLSVNKLTTTHIELFSMGPTGDATPNYENPNNIRAPLKTFITNMRAQNITTFIDFVNWNFEGTNGICNSKYTDAWFNSTLDFLINEIGTDKIILQVGGEFGGECVAKAQRWNDIAFGPAGSSTNTASSTGKWKGMKSWNKTGSPTSAPDPSWFFDYHPCSITNYGPDGAIVTTDCGGILDAIGQGGNGMAFANTAKLKAYACNVLKGGKKGFIYYGYGHQTIDSNAIIALGELVNNIPTNCASLEEEIPPGGPNNTFGGLVTEVNECEVRCGGEGTVWQVVIEPCKAGDTVAETAEYGVVTTTGYVCMDEDPPEVGETVLGEAVHDDCGFCENDTSGGYYIGGVTGPLGTGPGTDCDLVTPPTSQTEGDGNGDGGGSNWDWCGGAWCYAVPGISTIKLYDDIGSGFGLW
jgi:peptidoglycan hydrolase-like protein with peptidoglycan-binding domain